MAARLVLAAALAAAAALAVAAQEDLPVTADLVGLYEKVDASDFLSDGHCPSTMRFKTFAFDQFQDDGFQGFDFFNIKISHGNTRIGPDECTSSGAIWAIQSDHPAVTSKPKMLQEWAMGHRSGFTTWMAGEDFMDLAEDLDFVLAYDYVERECGETKFRAGATMLFIQPPFSVDLHEDYEMKKNENYLLITHANWDEDHGCVYIGGELASNTPDIAPGPVSDPSTEEGFTLAGASEEPAEEEEAEKEDEDEDDGEEDDDDDDDDDTGGAVFGDANSKANEGDDDEGGRCFPASATVELSTGDVVPMDHLAVGDIVKVAPGTYSPVFMFTHAAADAQSSFVELTTATGSTLTLTRGHYLYANGALMAASEVRFGDELMMSDGKATRVVSVSSRADTGLYNPQTLHGDLVVDGIVASTYTTAVEPTIAHSLLLAPARALFRASLGRWLVGILDNGASQLVRWLPSGAAAA